MFAPHGTGRGFELESRAGARRDRRASTRSAAVRPDARIVNADPLCHVALRPTNRDLAAEARDFNERLVFQTWDMLSGRLLPELGGSRDHLDIVGINYYWTNQWEWRIEPLRDGKIPPLADDDPRRVPLSELVRAVWERYGGDRHDHRDEPCRRHARPVAADGGGGMRDRCSRGRAGPRRLPLSDSRHARMAFAGRMDADGALGSRSRIAEPRGERMPPPMLDAFRETRNGSTILHATALLKHAEALDAGRRRKRRRAGSDDALQFAAE